MRRPPCVNHGEFGPGGNRQGGMEGPDGAIGPIKSDQDATVGAFRCALHHEDGTVAETDHTLRRRPHEILGIPVFPGRADHSQIDPTDHGFADDGAERVISD
jgi:hypothetical protein